MIGDFLLLVIYMAIITMLVSPNSHATQLVENITSASTRVITMGVQGQ